MKRYWITECYDPFEVKLGDKVYEVFMDLSNGCKYFPDYSEARAFAESYFDYYETDELEELDDEDLLYDTYDILLDEDLEGWDFGEFIESRITEYIVDLDFIKNSCSTDCPKCGKALLRIKDNYCISCGEEIVDFNALNCSMEEKLNLESYMEA